MLTKTVTYNDATLEVSRETMRSRLQKNIVYRKLADVGTTDEDYEFIVAYAHLVTQVTVTAGNLPFSIAALTDTDDEMKAAYAAFLDCDGSLWNVIGEALREVDAPLGDPDLAPGADAQKKTPPENEPS